jgi:NADH:ubiquinone oxidoreductase subunit 5 (subunit L)/multisubunit Na+/H+ antiporter MnhA subunit
MGKHGTSLPITRRALVIGRLSLCGIPFLAGYYSKDLILEVAQKRMTKRIGILLALIATLMTALYSIRTILFLFLKKKRNEINPLREET